MTNPDPGKRDGLLPSGCKDLIDVLRTKKAKLQPPPYPPVTRNIRLPEKVSIAYVAEVSGQSLHNIEKVMVDLRIIADRSLDFRDAQRLLRKYGIWADRESTAI